MEGSGNETRDDVLHVPSLYEYFCLRTAMDMRSSAKGDEAPATSFASIIISILAAAAFYVFGKTGLAKASFAVFALLIVWTVWGVVIRSSEQLGRRADNIESGVFPPISAPYVVARLKWWNHLISPLRWGRHSRLFDRKGRLEMRIADLDKKIAGFVAKIAQESGNAAAQAAYTVVNEDEIVELAHKINRFQDRSEYEAQFNFKIEDIPTCRAELLLCHALLFKSNEMLEKLDRIEKLAVTFHSVSPEDLSNLVNEAIQLLDERRGLVLNVDMVDPDDFTDMVTVHMG